MIKKFLQHKADLVFPGVTLLVVIALLWITALSFRFLTTYVTEALAEPRVEEGDLMRFNFEEFEELGLGK